MKCPKCQHENPGDSTFCGKCGTQLIPQPEAQPPFTETLETSSEELTRGTLFAGRYEIIEELGKGGMGKVYRVEDTKIKQEIALKLIKPEIASDKKTIERFKNELKTARNIRHKNVCGMFDLGEEKGTHYIAMEYVSGGDLKKLIHRTKRLDSGTAISIAKQICEGLAEAHGLGIVHRDLKPSNIMLDDNGNARIMDFGIARPIKGKGITGSGVMIGTPEYMSPEQVEAKEVDRRSDIYSLGIIMYEMLTGRLPFEAETPFAVGVMQKSEIPKNPREHNPQIPDDLNQIILKCLEKKPEDRFQTTAEIYSELTKIEQGLPTTDRTTLKSRPTTSKQITVSFTPKKLIIPALVLAALLLLVVLIWKPWGGRSLLLPSDSGLPSIGFLKLRNGTGNDNLDHLCTTIPDLLIFDLDQSQYFRVQSAEMINQVLRQMDLTEETSFASNELRNIARRSGVKFLITGYFSKLGENFSINISINDAETGDVIGRESGEGEGEGSIDEIVDQLTRKIKSNFNLTDTQLASDQDKEIGTITTPYPEAYRLYRQGRDLFLQEQYRESIPLMESAIQIDPDFAMAYRSIAVAYSNLGGYPDKVKEYYDKALDRSDRLSYKEKRLIEAMHSGVVKKDWRKSLSIFKEVLEEYPEDEVFNWDVATLYDSRLDLDNAIRHYEICRKNRSESITPYLNLAYDYRAIGEYGKAREVIRDYIQLAGDRDKCHADLAMSYLCEGRLDEATAEAQKAIKMNPRAFNMGFIHHLRGDFEEAEKEYERWLNDDDVKRRMEFHSWLAILNMTQGKYQKAASIIDDGLALANNEKDDYWSGEFVFLKILSEIAIAKYEKAIAEAQSNEALLGTNLPFILSFAYYKDHQASQAKIIRDAADNLLKMMETLDVADNSNGIGLKGMADLIEAKYDTATELLNRAWDKQLRERSLNDQHIVFLYYLGEAQYLGGNLEAARQTYEKAVNLTTGKLYWGDLWPKSHLRLGEVYEKLGNRSKAIEHTEKFLEMWKDADPGLPEVEDARKRLAGMKGN